MIDKYNEACFGEYCKSCKYRKLPETEYPCNECLAEPVNVFSCKPVRYEKGSTLFDPSQKSDHNYQRAVKYVPEKRKDSEKAIARDNIGAEYIGNKVKVINDEATDDQYPSAKAVKAELDKKASDESMAQALQNKIDIPANSCECGEFLAVKTVNDEGVPVEFETKKNNPDWNQNDETAADYIKNRIAYTEYEKVGTFHFTDGVLAEDEEEDYYNLIAKPFDTAGKNKDNNFTMTAELGGKRIAVYCSYYYNGNAHEISICDDPLTYYDYKVRFDCYFKSAVKYKVKVDGSTFTESDTNEVTFYFEDVVKLDEKYSPNGNIVNGNGLGSVKTIKSYNESHDAYDMGEGAFSEGYMTKASGDFSHTEGYQTTASGENSHAEGYGTTASGENSHAEGYGTTASGENSHAEGLYTKALSTQHVQGKHNVIDVYKVNDKNSTGKLESATYTTTSGGTAYNFAKTDDGYYTSQNKGVNSSVAYGKIIFQNYVNPFYLLITAISYGERNYDYGIISTLDTELAVSNTLDSTNVLHSFKGESSPSPQQFILYIDGGRHFITFKYIKDASANSNEDCFKIKFTKTDGEGTLADIVGNGTSDTSRSNAYALDWDGNAYYAGDVYANVEKGVKDNAFDENRLITANEFNYELDMICNVFPLIHEDIETKLPIPATATVGQIIAVKTVDDNGNVTETEAVDNTGGGDTGVTDALQYVEQTLTDEQKAQARENIGAGTSSFSGSYNDLTDKPTIPKGYTLPMASADVLGGVKPAAKTDAMTSAVGVDADGKLWSAAGGGTLPKYELIWEHTITAEETAVNLISITSTEFPKLTKCRGLVCEITAESNTKITPWVKLNINNIPVAQFTGLAKELPRWGVAVNRLFGRWLGQSVYNPQSENDNAAIVIPSYAGVFNTTFDADISSLSVGSYIAWATEGQIIRLWGCK